MPDLLIVAGPNGAGKSTIFPSVRKVGGSGNDALGHLPTDIPQEHFINPDDIAVGKGVSEFEAGKLAIKTVDGYLENGRNFALETTMSGMWLLKYLKKARAQDYKIFMAYMFLSSAELSMARVTQRALLGKHYIPMDRILRRYKKSLSNFCNTYRQYADFWVLANNSTLSVEALCSGGRLFSGNSVYAENQAQVDFVNGVIRAHHLDCQFAEPVGNEDCVSSNVFSLIQAAVKEEIINRPYDERMRVVIEEHEEIRFVSPWDLL